MNLVNRDLSAEIRHWFVSKVTLAISCAAGLAIGSWVFVAGVVLYLVTIGVDPGTIGLVLCVTRLDKHYCSSSLRLRMNSSVALP